MNFYYILFICLSSLLVSCAGPAKTSLRSVAGKEVKDYQAQVCGKLERIRYESHGLRTAVKLRINNGNIKFYKSNNELGLKIDSAMLAKAFMNDKIQVCYYPTTDEANIALDFLQTPQP